MKKIPLTTLLLSAAALYFLIAGASQAWQHSYDFVDPYTGARCLLHGCNPYDTHQLKQQYVESGAADPVFLATRWPVAFPPVYPPSAFVVAVPLALLPFRAAEVIWFLIDASLFLVALWMVLSASPSENRWLANLLAAVFLLDSVVLLKAGQPACFSIALLIISCILFSRRSRPVLAACLLCLSLAMKPQIGGLIALYLLIERANRRYVAAAMAGAVAILLVGAVLLQINPSSKTWVTDLRTNIADSVLPGHINDPTSPTAGEVNIQTAAIVVFSNPTAVSVVAYGSLLILLAAWIIALAKRGAGADSGMLLLGALLIFSMLPVYHRIYDTSLLLLTIPSVLLIWNNRRVLGCLVALVTLLACVPIQPNANAWLMSHHPAIRQSILDHKLLFLLILREQNLAMILLFCLYIAALFTIHFSGGSGSGGSQPAGGRPRLSHATRWDRP